MGGELGLLYPKEYTLWVFENSLVRRIFGPKKKELTGGWRKWCNEELHNLYSLPNNIMVTKLRRIKWEIHGRINAYKILVGRPEGDHF
jgi:hypothetical protein